MDRNIEHEFIHPMITMYVKDPAHPTPKEMRELGRALDHIGSFQYDVVEEKSVFDDLEAAERVDDDTQENDLLSLLELLNHDVSGPLVKAVEINEGKSDY